MKLEKISCPSCGAGINMDIKGQESIFCPFCGSQFSINNGNKTFTHNINSNIHKQYTNTAAVVRENRKDRENQREHNENIFATIVAVLLLVISMGSIKMSEIKRERDEKLSIEAGMIQVGQSSSALEGKKYQGVVEQLQALGFTNIVTVDMDDANWFKKREKDTIDTISIDGDASFSSNDYFDPNATIIISYH